MARYTELFSEWLEEGGQLPALFSEIEGFGDLFTATYCDREIGFETPVLFEIKLNAYADLHIPEYKERIDLLVEAIAQAGNPSKTRTRSGDETNTRTGAEDVTYSGSETNAQNGTNTMQRGAQKDTTTEYPYSTINPTDNLQPSNVVDRDTYTDTDSVDMSNTRSFTNRKDTRNYDNVKDVRVYNDVKDMETGYTPDELLRYINELHTKVYNVKKELLREFEPLFMQIYA